MVRNKFYQLHNMKFDLFKSQNPEIGRYDVVFELEGKRLYAHKNMLNLVSDTFDAMLSERWTSKDEPIKLTNYTFDEFYQFLTFLYSGRCQLTDENIASMVDMAEFYHVELFKTYCDEHLVIHIKLTNDNIFKFMDLAEKYSLIRLKKEVQSFILDNSSFLNSEHFLKLKKSEVQKIVAVKKDVARQEDLFQAVYKWTENQVSSDQENTTVLNHNVAIKSEISDFLPFINFNKMSMPFLLQVVFPRGFIFPSLDEISKIVYSVFSINTKVTVTNADGQKLHGNITPDQSLYERIKMLKSSAVGVKTLGCWWEAECKIPSIPCPLQKRDEVEWYLLYLAGGEIGILHKSLVRENYLLAEMSPENGKEFSVTPGCKIEIE